ncbi:hypothetical protein G9A89_001713 [Geosiphon pyriformis]|nr:hypothetical protein G9A89_001713 [Geosiphon pyriformis]
MPISEVLGDSVFFGVACLLMHYGITFMDQLLNKKAADVRPCMSVDHSVNPVVAGTISEAQTILLNSGLVSFDVFTDSSVKHFGSCFVVAGTAAFFPKLGLGIGVKVQEVMSSTLVELKAIALVLTCVLSDSSVFIHSDSQTALFACSDELLLACPDFKKNL